MGGGFNTDANDIEGIEAKYEAERTRRIEAAFVKEGVFGRFVASFLLAPARYYLDEARKAQKLEMTEASALLCRVSMEATLYAFLYGSSNPLDPMGVRIVPPRDGRGRVKWVSLEKLRSKLEDQEVLNDEETEALKTIQRHGNEIAHTVGTVQASLPEMPPDPLMYNDIVHLMPEELEQDLRSAERIFVTLSRTMAERNQANAQRCLDRERK